MENEKTLNISMFLIKHKNNPKISINIHFDIIRLNNERHMVLYQKTQLILVWLVNKYLAPQEALNA